MGVLGRLFRQHHVWSADEWEALDSRTRHDALAAGNDADAFEAIAAQAHRVLWTYSTSFFMVTRFLPRHKRIRVEVIYAAVRFPDEIVDSFPWNAQERRCALSAWRREYERALACPSLIEALKDGVPSFVAGFAQVVRDAGIPAAHYHAFLDAMELDISPHVFSSIDDLIDRYIHGSAVVVGYFLTHVYGSARAEDFPRALETARDLAIALQLTNFIRDVTEDQRRGRCYLPLDLLREAGVVRPDVHNPAQAGMLASVVRRVARIAKDHYTRASAGVDAFAADSRTAIRACIGVYGQLNERIASNTNGFTHRESVPIRVKLRALPRSKYWRLPIAMLHR